MSLLVRSVRLIANADGTSAPEGPVDLLIGEGRILKIGADLSADPLAQDAERVEGAAYASPGWFDTFARFCDPGDEFKEDLLTGANAAAAGGFTGVAVIPDTNPPLDAKPEIEYVLARTASHPVDVRPMGSISQGGKGEQLAELIDMDRAGAVAFCEGDQAIVHSGLLLRALRYVRPFSGLIVHLAQDPNLVGKGEVHEGEVSTRMGFPGIPDLAETLMLQRDLSLAEYVNGRIHFPMLSSRAGVEMIRKAKSRGLKVTAGVAAYQLVLDETHTSSYDALYKVRPPLRGADDREALIEGLLDGTIDVVCSGHIPQHQDGKKLEFEYADVGINGLETTFSCLCAAMEGRDASTADFVRWLSDNPRKIFSMEQPQIAEGAAAELTLFSPSESWTPETLRSRSRNNPFLGQELKGKVNGIISAGQFVPNSSLPV